MTHSTHSIPISRLTKGCFNAKSEDIVAVEEPLEIKLFYFDNSKLMSQVVSITMRTPGSDAELAMGFLFTERIVSTMDSIDKIEEKDKNSVHIFLKNGYNVDLKSLERNFYTTSSCGVCGKSSLDAIHTISTFDRSNEAVRIHQNTIFSLNSILDEKQILFKQTGGTHASALFDTDGNFIKIYEDVGRHNALDKLIGAQIFLKEYDLSNKVLFLSGRVSFELVQKAAAVNIPIIIAVGAPSSLAVDLAMKFGMTLVGFVKEDRMNIYSGIERIKFEN